MKDGQGFVRRVTSENLERFAPLLGRRSESDSTESADSQTTSEKVLLDPELQAAEALFSGNPIRIRIPSRFSYPGKVTKKRFSRRKFEKEKAATQSVSVFDRGQLIWQKENLPGSDVQQSRRGHPTGGLRLVQADWKVDDKIIDQTRYFRNIVFGQLNWTVGIHKPKKQEAVSVSFAIKILGQDYGLWNLIISHKPSGEAGQGNYTTILHWGDLASTIKELNLVGKTLRLYAPPENQHEPFFIEII